MPDAELNDTILAEHKPAAELEAEYGELSLTIGDAKLREWKVSMPYPPDDLDTDAALSRAHRSLMVLIGLDDKGPADAP